MKPISSSTKDWLVDQTAKDLEIDEKICNRVISWVYLKTKEMAPIKNSIEISGFGKLLLSPVKTKKKIGRLEQKRKNLMFMLTPQNEEYVTKKLLEVDEMLEHLNNRLNEI